MSAATQAATGEADPERHVAPRWLSCGAEHLAERIRREGEQAAAFDVAIVGSGYGAAVAAARFSALARIDEQGRSRNLRVVVLERGDEFVPGAFPDRFSNALPHLRADRWTDADPPNLLGIDESQTGLDQALFDFKLGEQVSALVGNGLGGGSLINAGVAERPEPWVFDDPAWPVPLRHALSQVNGSLAKAFAQAEEMLGAAPFTGMPPKSAALSDDIDALQAAIGGAPIFVKPKVAVTQRAGRNAQGVMQQACIGCGNCVTGCNFWAKNTLAMNYLALAKRQGAEIYTGAMVLDVCAERGTHSPGEAGTADTTWAVGLRLTHDRGERDRPAARLEISARHVVLAAGTYGSTRILHQSALADPAALGHLVNGPNAALGKGFSCNGDGIAAAFDQSGRNKAVEGIGADPSFDQTRPASIGPTISGMLDLRGRLPRERRFVIQDAAIPFALRRFYEEALTSFGMVHAMSKWNERAPGGAVDPATVSDERIGRSQFLLLVGHDDAGWELRFRSTASTAGAGPRATRLSSVGVARRPAASFEAVRERQEEMNGVVEELTKGRTGGTFIPNPLWRPASEELLEALRSKQPGSDADADPLGAGRLLTVHPLGGCRMADDSGRGVVNHLGQVFRLAHGKAVFSNLVVMDGSIVPRSLGINPLLTITALAERACAALALQWGYDAGDGTLRPLHTQPDPVSPMPWRPMPTELRFTETMDGPLELFVNKDVRLAELDRNARIEALDARGRLEVRATFGSLWDLCRDPLHHVPQAEAKLKLFWKGSRPSGKPPFGLMPAQPLQPIELALDIRLLELLPSTPNERIWRALRHWWATRGKAFLQAEIGNVFLRGLAAALVTLVLGIRSERCRGWLRRVLDCRWVQRLGEVARQVLATARIASHHGEARTMRYELGKLDAAVTPFEGEVRVLAAKRIHYAMSPGYRRRLSKGVVKRRLPKQVPSNPWRAVVELQVLMVSEREGRRMKASDWPVDQRPAWLTLRHRVVAAGTWSLDLDTLIGTGLPQLQSFQSLPDAWLDMASFAAFFARCLGQTYFWSWRLPAYPKPLPLIAGADLGPLPGYVLDSSGERYVELPGRGSAWEQHVVDLPPVAPAKSGKPEGRRPTAMLTNFRPSPGAPRRNHPVVLMHGFVTSGYQFATPRLKTNAVQWLTGRGFDVWVLDLRTSIALASSHEAWDFDIVAKEDIPMAFRKVLDLTGTEQLHVVAHCMGSAVFNMAVLAGCLDEAGRSLVRSAVQTQVGMDVVSTPPNRLKASGLRFVEDIFDAQELTVAAEFGALGANRIMETLFDRFAMTWPQNDVDARLQLDNALWRPRQDFVATINRINALYGRNFSHANLNADVRGHLQEVFRHASLATFRHVMQFHRAGRVVDRDGNDAYVTDANISTHYTFPVRFIHGQYGAVFGQASTRRSRIRLDALLPWIRHERVVLRAPLNEKKEVLHPDWGHFDIWLSERSAAEVFPKVSSFLEREDKPRIAHDANAIEASAAASAAPLTHYIRQAPDLGPCLGRWRADPSQSDAAVARLWFRSPFRGGTRVEAKAMTTDSPSDAGAVLADLSGRWETVELLQGCGALDVRVPHSAGTQEVVVVCRSPQARSFADAASVAHPGTGRQLWNLPIGKKHDLLAGQRVGYVQLAADSPVKGYLGGGPWKWLDGKLDKPLPAAVLEQFAVSDALDVDAVATDERHLALELRVHPIKIGPQLFRQLGRAGSLDFLLASCRYQATEMEAAAAGRSLENAADESFDFALFLGDQIYADASYGVLDGRPSATRLRNKYESFWNSTAGMLGKRMPVYLCGDDHEVRDDWYRGLRTNTQQKGNDAAGLLALDAYQYRAMPGPLPREAGAHRDYEFEAAGFFFYVLDVRFERGAPGTRLWSVAQRDRLRAWLGRVVPASAGRPVFIASSVPVFPFTHEVGTTEDLGRGDAWQAYPDSMMELFDALFAACCPRVVFLAGDLHLSHRATGWIHRSDGASIEVDSIVSSGLHAPLPFANRNPGDMGASYNAAFAACSPYRVEYCITDATSLPGYAHVRVEHDQAGVWAAHVDFSATRSS